MRITHLRSRFEGRSTWVSIHHGGGVGIELAARKLERVLRNDPGMGVLRHVDAGYDLAAQVAEERGVRVPMAEG